MTRIAKNSTMPDRPIKKRLMASHTSCRDHNSSHWHNQLDLLSLTPVLEGNLATLMTNTERKPRKKIHNHFRNLYFVPECLPFDESLLLSLPLKGCLPDLFCPFEAFLDADGIWEWLGVLVSEASLIFVCGFFIFDPLWITELFMLETLNCQSASDSEESLVATSISSESSVFVEQNRGLCCSSLKPELYLW